MQPAEDQALWMYRTMVKSRKFEQALAKAYLEGKQPAFNMANGPLPGEMHLSDGQEPPAVGLNIHLTAEDHLACGHRPHAHAIAKGVDLKAMAAEIFGKKSGLSEGRGGHMHLFDPSHAYWCSGIIGQGIGPAVGAAMAFKMQGKTNVAIAAIGEGGANAGPFHEGLNLAALWKLPFILLIEDNGWAVSVPKAASTAVARNDVRAVSYGIAGVHVAGNDPDAVFSACGEAIRRARQGEGPTLIEVETLRIAGHFQGDAEGYRPAEELEAKAARDPIPLYRARLVDKGWLTAEQDSEFHSAAQTEVDEAIAYAMAANYPEPHEAMEKLYV